jgi:hypothetical protein
MPTAPRARALRELADQRPNGSARRGDHHGVTGPRGADQPHPGIRREPGHAEHTEGGRDRRHGRIKLAQAGAIGERVRAPAGGCEDEVTCRIRGMVGGEHLRHRVTRHDLAERERRRVGLPVIHQEAHVGVERQVLHPKEQLPGTRGRDRGVFQAEVGHVRRALRARGEDDVACHRKSHIDTSTQML